MFSCFIPISLRKLFLLRAPFTANSSKIKNYVKMFSFEDLPAEVIWEISKYLDTSQLKALAITNKTNYRVLRPRLLWQECWDCLNYLNVLSTVNTKWEVCCLCSNGMLVISPLTSIFISTPYKACYCNSEGQSGSFVPITPCQCKRKIK